VLWIADHGVEVDDRVEMAWSANPLIDSLTVGLAQRAWVVVAGTNVRSDGGSVNAQAVRVGARDDLLVGGDDTLHKGRVICLRNFTRAREAAEIVDALKNDDPLDGCGSKYVAIEAGQDVGAVAVD
jgi:hypothetical protein